MSKLANIRMYQYTGDPGFVDALAKGFGKVKGLFKKVAPAVQSLISPKSGGGMDELARQLGLGGGGGGGGAAVNGGGGGGGRRRRSRGITSRELRGYRKVSNLLHREGMVSRRARGRK